MGQKGIIELLNNSGFRQLVTMGQIPGFSVIDKFGKNPTITTTSDPEDCWEGGGIYPYDANGTNPIISIASSSESDNQVISILGQTSDGVEVNQEVTLNGTTRVALPTPLWRVYRMENEADVGGDSIGNIFIYTGTGTVPNTGDPEVRAMIINGNNQTLMALYTIPKGKVGFLYYGDATMQFTGGAFTGVEYANMKYLSRRYGKIFKTKKEFSLNSSANSIFKDERRFPDIIPSGTDVKLHISEVSGTMGISASFDILLVDEKLLDPAFLAAIGQR